MVGEVRDNETAELAIHAALTGHVVLSTLHTTDAPGSIARLVDMDIAPFLLGSTLHTVVAQRLARKICPKCKEKISIPEEYIADIKKELGKIGTDFIKEIIPNYIPEELFFFKGKGCPSCGNTGYRGRVSVSEVLDVNEKVKEEIFKAEKHLTLEFINTTQKYTTIYQDGIIKILQGLTTMEELLRVMTN
jgi:type IV pilus assembly protein PilB